MSPQRSGACAASTACVRSLRRRAELNTSLLAAGLLDELFLTIAPKLAGGSGALTIIGDTPPNEPLDAQLVWLLEHDGELFARYRVRATRDPAADHCSSPRAPGDQPTRS
jgi:RibD C-terminal domain